MRLTAPTLTGTLVQSDSTRNPRIVRTGDYRITRDGSYRITRVHVLSYHLTAPVDTQRLTAPTIPGVLVYLSTTELGTRITRDGSQRITRDGGRRIVHIVTTTTTFSHRLTAPEP